VNDPEERRRRGEAAYEAARSRYSWPSLVEGVAQVYTEVCEGRDPSGDALTEYG
jgi:glycosyltransferase involved in cell wall biosynthesis